MSNKTNISGIFEAPDWGRICAITILGLIFSFSQVEGQNYIEDFAKMYRAYQGLEDFHTNLEVAFTEGGTQKSENQSGEIWKSGNQYRYRLDNITMLYNDRFILAVDAQAETIALSKRSGENIETLDFVAKDFGEVQKRYEKVEFAGKEKGQLHYRVYTPGADIILTEIYLDAKTFLIDHLEYDYNPDAWPEGTRAWVRYVDMDLEPEFQSHTFSEDPFILQSKEGYEPTSSYADYQLLINPESPQ